MSRFANRKQEVAERFSQAAPHYAAHADLQAAIADVLLAAAIPAGVILDVGCGRGRETQILSARAGVEKIIALDMAPAMLAALPASPKIQPLQGDMENMALPDVCVDGVFSNFALQWGESPATVMTELARVLRPGGRLLASVPGPASLAALRAGGLLQVNTFATPEQWQQALQQGGFSDIEIQRQDFSAYYANAIDLLRALKGIGAGTSDHARANHLLGRQWWQKVAATLEQQRQPEGLPLHYEVIFMQAQKG